MSTTQEVVEEASIGEDNLTNNCRSRQTTDMPRKPYGSSRRRKSSSADSKDHINESGFLNNRAKPSVYHAVVVIFLEFFAWGLLTAPTLSCLAETFGQHTLLINGLIQGIKGLLSFLAAPLLGALSDVWGRRMFLLLTVFCTCIPIPLMSISPWWFFALLSISGTFAVTFSIVFAYVADITDEEERSSAYGLVSATFAASLVTSPAIGQYMESNYGRDVVVAFSSSIALLDVIFIALFVPESLPEKVRPSGWSQPISWDRVDPFSSLRTAMSDSTSMLMCLCVFLSYLPEAGQYSCIFIYLTKLIGFTQEQVTTFIAVVGILSILAQTVVMSTMIQSTSKLTTILVALSFQAAQLFCYAFGRSHTIMWIAGGLAAMSSISYPAISTLVSAHADVDQQGLVQGMITGVRGLCSGLGPAVYGLIFFIFNVNGMDPAESPANENSDPGSNEVAPLVDDSILPGPPFLFGGCSVIFALMIAALLPKKLKDNRSRHQINIDLNDVNNSEQAETLLQKS